MRTTKKTLEFLVSRINSITGMPEKPWERVGDRNIANVGNFHLSGAYGGYCLHRMHNTGGGVTTPLNAGHIPARDMETALRAFITGLELSSYLDERLDNSKSA